MFDETVATGKWVGSIEEWERIKSIRTKLKGDLSFEDEMQISAFIDEKYGEDIYVLKCGALEAYLPNGYGRKDIDKLITLVNEPNFEDLLPKPQGAELVGIADAIERVRQEMARGTL